MHEPLTTPSQKFNRRLRFAAIASFCVSLPVFAWFVLFSSAADLQTVSAAKANPFDVLYAEGQSLKVIAVPDVKGFYSNLNKNAEWRKLLGSQSGANLVSILPIKALGVLGSVINYLPEQMQEKTIVSLFPDGFYYAGSEHGYVLLATLSKIAELAAANKEIKNYHFKVQDGWMVLASSDKLLKAQLQKLKNTGSDRLKNFAVAEGSAGFYISTLEREKPEKDVAMGLIKTLFPSRYISAQKVILTPGENGMTITSDAELTADGKNQLTANITELPTAYSYDLENPSAIMTIVSPLSLSAWLKFFAREDFPFQNAAASPTLLTYHGLINDSGILMPSIGFKFNQDAGAVSSFLERAFLKGRYIKDNFENGTRVSYQRYEWNNPKARYKFMPALTSSNDGNVKIFTTDEGSRKDFAQVLKSKGESGKKIQQMAKASQTEKPILVFSVSINKLLAQLGEQIKEYRAVYMPEGFYDLRDSLAKTQIPVSLLQGSLWLGTEKIRMHAHWKY